MNYKLETEKYFINNLDLITNGFKKIIFKIYFLIVWIDFEIQTPQGLIHKIINMASDAAVDRTCFDQLAEIRVEDNAEIKLIVSELPLFLNNVS